MSLVIILFAIAVAILLFIFAASFTSRQNRVDVDVSRRIDWSAIQDDELQSYLPDQKIAAIKRYRELTASGLREAKMTIDYIVANPDAAKKGKRIAQVDTDGAGLKDLLLDGQVEEAVKVYAAFMGVDTFTAQDAIAEMQRELEVANNLSDSDNFETEYDADKHITTAKHSIEEME